MRRSPGTCRVHTGRQNSYLLSLIRGVQPHDTTFLKQTTVLKMLLVETNQMVWVEQSLLLLRQAFQFSVLSFLPAFFPIFSYCICILTVSGCMLPHGLISTSLTLFFRLPHSSLWFGKVHLFAFKHSCSSLPQSKNKFPTACPGFFSCVFIPFHGAFHLHQSNFPKTLSGALYR